MHKDGEEQARRQTEDRGNPASTHELLLDSTPFVSRITQPFEPG
jgi:hypothetical protein